MNANTALQEVIRRGRQNIEKFLYDGLSICRFKSFMGEKLASSGNDVRHFPTRNIPNLR